MEQMKILIVEDEKVLADVLEAKLEKEGYDVEVAYDGESGYNKVYSFKPQLILLDIVMPKMNGYEVLEKLFEDKNQTPVIIISNSGQPVEIEKTKKLGAVDHLIKTQFDPSEVVVKVKNYLNPGAVSESKEDAAFADTGKVKVLLVEDDKFLRNICSKKLNLEGFEVFEATDGPQALEQLEKARPHIVLLDIILPSMDGFEILAKVRGQEDKEIAKTPVIMLSNLGQESDVQKAMNLGANNFLIKANFTTSEIVKKIKETLASL